MARSLTNARAVGGNTDAFFESIAKQFDKDCQILKNNPQDQFVAGLASAGMSLGAQSIPKFCVLFKFSVKEPIEEAENLLNKLKPAHVRFVFIYPNQKVRPFVAGKSCAGDSFHITGVFLMHEITGATALNGHFIDGTSTQSGTIVSADWLNTVQDEICNLITSVGIALNSDTSDDKKTTYRGYKQNQR